MDPKSTTTTEDRLIEGLVDRLNDDMVPVDGSGETTEAERLLCEYTELLGLLPYESAEQRPSARLKEKLMATIEGSQAGHPESPVAEVIPIRAPSRNRWALPLAATLTFALLGLAGWQYVHLEEQRGTIEDLAGRLSDANKQSVELTASFEAELEHARNKLALVTSRGVEVCSLRPTDHSDSDPSTRGTLFVAADHESWYLSINKLEPCPQGRAYQLWFVLEDGTSVNGGILEAKAGQGLEITSQSMPAGTVAVTITMEPPGGSDIPSGPAVLHGDDVMKII